MNGCRTFARLIIGAVISVSLTACGTSFIEPAPQAAVDKAGANPAPVEIRLGTDDDESRPGADQIREFARHVADGSDGSMSVTPVWQANGGDYRGGWDQVVARMVMDGSLDMAMIPARAWDTEGVLSLQALEAPFLVTSDELAAWIATSDLATDLMSGLDAVGVTGLALAPESLRHLFLFGDPPMSVADLAGAVIRSPRSNTTWALFEALGARGEDFTDPGTSFEDALAAGEIRGYESSFALASSIPSRMTAVGNLPLFPKVNVLVVNNAVYDQLTDQQRAILADAAREMVRFAIDAMPDTVGYAEQYCRNDGRIVLADDTFLGELHEAVQPVFDGLATDPTTASLIDRIRAAAAEIGAEPPAVAACEPDLATPSAPSGSSTGAFPDGVYRADIPLEELLGAGVDKVAAVYHAGPLTLAFHDGELGDPDCPGTSYAVEGGHLTITFGRSTDCGDAAGKVMFSADWTVDGEQLTFHDVQSGYESQILIRTMFERAWTKID